MERVGSLELNRLSLDLLIIYDVAADDGATIKTGEQVTITLRCLSFMVQG